MNEVKLNEIISLAWDDKVSFDQIEEQFGLNENDVKKIMKKNLKSKSYENWRKRIRWIKEK